MKVVTYGVREVQAQIGKALRIVDRGGTVLVTSRGRPVAMIVAPDMKLAGESDEDWKLRRMAAEGRIIPGNGRRIRRFKGFPIGGGENQVIADRKARQDLLEGRS
ncbi:MAG TPA: type II toxin-antitoxin system prevent-host-death family antitoxin [Planctomycetota bacterium]|nr:type II toxin-antitoxin system prevent-host-death family antitoxin [Planctomycetota bacterium]